MQFRTKVHVNGFRPGDVLEITEDRMPEYAGMIARGFLEPADDDAWIASQYGETSGAGAPSGGDAESAEGAEHDPADA